MAVSADKYLKISFKELPLATCMDHSTCTSKDFFFPLIKITLKGNFCMYRNEKLLYMKVRRVSANGRKVICVWCGMYPLSRRPLIFFSTHLHKYRARPHRASECPLLIMGGSPCRIVEVDDGRFVQRKACQRLRVDTKVYTAWILLCMRKHIATTSETKCFYIYNSCQQTTTNICMCSLMLKDSCGGVWDVWISTWKGRLVRESSLYWTKRTNKGFFSVNAHHFVIYYSIHRNDFNVDHLVFSFYLPMIFCDYIVHLWRGSQFYLSHTKNINPSDFFLSKHEYVLIWFGFMCYMREKERHKF